MFLNASRLDTWLPEAVFDYYAGLCAPLWTRRRVLARITAIHPETPTANTLVLQTNGHWKGCLPGQHVQLTVEINGVRHSRSYTPTFATANTVHLTIKRINTPTVAEHASAPGSATGSVSVSQWIHQQLTPGSIVELSQAFGTVVLPNPRPTSMVLIAGGSGMTPMLHILRTLAKEQSRSNIRLLQYAPTRDELLFSEELLQLQQQLPHYRSTTALTQPTEPLENQEESMYLSGHFCDAHWDSLAIPAPDWILVCGPSGLRRQVAAWAQNNHLDTRLHYEPVLPFSPPGGKTVQVTSARSERQLQADTQLPLLQQAEAAGWNPTSGCRQGLCMSCHCKKLRGQVENLLTGQLSDTAEEVIRLCVSRPVTDLHLDL